MNRNRRKWLKVRIAAATRDHYMCVVCGRPAVDVHHIMFRSHGGKDELQNVVCLCRKHHIAAHGVEVKTWRRFFKDYIRKITESNEE